MYLKLYNVGIEQNFHNPSVDFSLLLRFLSFYNGQYFHSHYLINLISSITERQLTIFIANI